jgi:hypothetical protein
MGNEVVRLSGARALAGIGKVISTADQADMVGSIVLLGEEVAGIVSAFCGLSIGLAREIMKSGDQGLP